jgi:hypothetical protein
MTNADHRAYSCIAAEKSNNHLALARYTQYIVCLLWQYHCPILPLDCLEFCISSVGRFAPLSAKSVGALVLLTIGQPSFGITCAWPDERGRYE